MRYLFLTLVSLVFAVPAVAQPLPAQKSDFHLFLLIGVDTDTTSAGGVHPPRLAQAHDDDPAKGYRDAVHIAGLAPDRLIVAALRVYGVATIGGDVGAVIVSMSGIEYYIEHSAWGGAWPPVVQAGGSSLELSCW